MTEIRKVIKSDRDGLIAVLNTLELFPPEMLDDMIADYFTKPLTGTKFRDMWNKIMNQYFPQCEDTGVKS